MPLAVYSPPASGKALLGDDGVTGGLFEAGGVVVGLLPPGLVGFDEGNEGLEPGEENVGGPFGTSVMMGLPPGVLGAPPGVCALSASKNSGCP